MINDTQTQELLEHTLNGNVVLFLGTASLLSSTDVFEKHDLTAELIRYCGYNEPDRSFAKVAEYYELSLGRQNLEERVCNWIEQQKQQPSLFDQTVARMPFNIVVTTRTDLMLEQAYRQAGISITSIVREGEIAFNTLQKVSLVKMHGSIDQKDSLVLTERDHLDIFRKRPILSDFIKVLYAGHTILFIDYDLDNYYSKLLHREITQGIGRSPRRSYAIVEQATEYMTKYWLSNNVKIIDRPSLSFLQALQQDISKYQPAPRASEKEKSAVVHTYPYKFLDHFDTSDSDLFFGRYSEINLLSRRILAHRLLVQFGASGVGKTSLIKAGLMPELKQLEVFPIYSRCLDTSLLAVEKAITDAVSAQVGWDIEPRIDGEHRLLSLLLQCQQAVGKQIVLFIDQMEELFRISVDQQEEFIQQLARCIEEESRLGLHVVFSLRDDRFTELDSLRHRLPLVYHNVFHLTSLSETAAVDAIVRPIAQYSVKYEDKLVEELIKDLLSEGKVAPAQLQIVCSRLYEQFSHEQSITVEHYHGRGGAGKILGDYLEEVLNRFSVPLRGTASHILEALVSSEQTKKLLAGSEIARQLRQNEQLIHKLLLELEDARLLRKVETEEGYKYELVHDYLVQQIWQNLAEGETNVKEIQELIETETRYWPKYRTPLSKEKLKAIYTYWDRLILTEAELELLFRSSISFGHLKEWEQVAQSLGDKLIPLYLHLLDDAHSDVGNLAAIALNRLGAQIQLDTALARMDDYRQSSVRDALRQLTEGRPTKDFAAQAADPSWHERSLWNTSTVVGIDFGTTACAVAVIRDGNPVIIPNREGSKFTPSVVAFTAKEEIVVGTSAALQAATNPDRTIFSIKRQLGTDWQITIAGTTYTAIDIAALIFKSLKQDAETYLERQVTQAVVTVPAYFNAQQLSAVKEAATHAGFEVLRMIAEPTAACMAYGLNQEYERQVAVYDLGGGTFDISLLQLGDGVFEVKAVNGNTTLGGDDFDQRVVDYLIRTFKMLSSIDLSEDGIARVRLKEEAERAKIALSGLEVVKIYIPYIYADSRGIQHLDIDLSRSTFEELTHDLVDATIDCCKRALDDVGGLSSYKDDADGFELVLVGLSTKIPLIRQSVSNFFGVEPRRGVDPDEAVALGAAIQAGVLAGDIHEKLLLDVIPLSLGIESLGGVMTPLIERNTTLPTRKRYIFSTATDGQREVEIRILQGEHETAVDNSMLGVFLLEGIPPAPRGIPQIEITFDMDQNSILSVSAKDKATGKEQRITVSGSTGDHGRESSSAPMPPRAPIPPGRALTLVPTDEPTEEIHETARTTQPEQDLLKTLLNNTHNQAGAQRKP